VYNDAVFSDADWKGIRMLHESIKEDDPMKVGRFGLGFKSVFHMTGWNAVVNSSQVKQSWFCIVSNVILGDNVITVVIVCVTSTL